MENPFLKGIVSAIAYYATAALLAYITYLIVGHVYTHALALHHIVLFVAWLGGCAWGIYSIVNRFLGNNITYNRGVALVHIVVCSAAFLVVYREYNTTRRDAATYSRQNSITTEFSGDTAIVRHNGNIIFLRIADSVYYDQLSKMYPPDSILNER